MPELLREARPVLRTVSEPAGSAIASLGVALPERQVPNREIAERLGVDPSWIETRTGVRSRHVAGADERLIDFAAAAGVAALEDAGFDAAELDLVIVATCSHDQLTPSASALIAAQLGTREAGVLDVNAACSGFVSALDLAAAQIESRRAESVLVIGADLLSRLTDRDDRGTAGLFADGAGAVLVRSVAAPGRLGPVVLGSDGSLGDLVYANRDEGLIRMNGADTFRQAVDRLSESTLGALRASGREIEEIDVFVYHQANSRIISAVGERLGLPAERVVDCMAKFGNTSAASVPIALAEARSDGLLIEGSTALLAAFGAGLTWAAVVVEWGLGEGEGWIEDRNEASNAAD
jgi:3-oxoacyl-[acyl-carrier-protein] synthase-3